ncbi:MAG: methionyl-tRNA formyltransferase [Verrucomicrobiota bacterium]|nr:methionyl-tRNA formyltransferase [Verrucomicrobiota bacterium]
MRIVFIGTADLACPSLDLLSKTDGMKLVAVVTQPDRPAGRQLKLTPSPVKEAALKIHLPIFQPEKIRSPQALEQIKYWHPDVVIVAAYGQLIPKSILDIPKYGCLNVHASLLPKYRGAAPIQWALLNGERSTGITIMQMNTGLDTGDILLQKEIPIRRHDNAQTIHDKLAHQGAELLVHTLKTLPSNTIKPIKQGDSPTPYARKITKEDTRLDWSRMPLDLWLQIRSFSPRPGAFTLWNDGVTDKILKVFGIIISRRAKGQPGEIVRIDSHGILVAAKSGGLLLREVQLEGRKRMSAAQLGQGNLLKVGQILK